MFGDLTSRPGSPDRHRTRILPPPRRLRPCRIKIGHLALIRLDVCGVGVILDEWSDVIVIRQGPVVVIYSIRHINPVNIVPSRVVHEVHAFFSGVTNTLHTPTSRRTSVEDISELGLIDGISGSIGIVPDSIDES